MFMAFPLNGRPDWRHPPWVTMLLIVVNCLIYFGPQRADEEAWQRAGAYYARSDLPGLELPRYAAWLRQQGGRRQLALADQLDRALAHGRPPHGVEVMEWDRNFQTELRAGRILHPGEPEYDTWRRQRSEFDRLKGSGFTARWASNPAAWDPWSMITAAFLHGSTAHLIGNMIFLFAFGYTVELALGGSRYLAFYLLAGMAGEAGDLLARWNSPVIGLGASGAISGLMAMYAILYGRRKIRFFYQFLFYFDYVKAPAIILLPIWIGHEFLQQALHPEGGVAYMAHAGGLIGGGLLAWWHKRRHPDVRMPEAREAGPDPFVAARARAEALLKSMRIDEARAAYAGLARQRPQDRDTVSRYFHLARLAPAAPDLPQAAAQVLALEGDDEATLKLIAETYAAYGTLAGQEPPLAPEALARLALRLARAGHVAEAEQLVLKLLTRSSGHAAGVLLALTRARLQRNEREPAARHARVLELRFPGSNEARIAADLLR